MQKLYSESKLQDMDLDLTLLLRLKKTYRKKTKTKASDIPSAKFKPIPPLFLKDATATANIVKMITEIGIVILLFFSNIWLFKVEIRFFSHFQ